MNAEQASKCYEISKEKYKNKELAAALKFAIKANQLDSLNIQARNWLEFLKKNPQNNTDNTTNSSEKSRVKTRSKVKQENDSARPFTPDQVVGIKKILDCKGKGDLYGILGLEKGCTDNEIKKAYRKMALLYHPDKCGAPGTDDAFKAIGHSWTVLGDSDKRANYDRFGIDSESSASRSTPAGAHGFQGFGGRGFEGEITPEDLLRMFMGGGGGFGGGPQFQFHTNRSGFRGNFARGRGQNTQHQQTHTGLGATIMQLLPVLLLFLISTVSFFTNEDDPFSFRRSYEYSAEKTTSRHNVKYFVNPRNYARRYSTARKKNDLANQVESEYLFQLKNKCAQERQTREFYIRQATGWFSVDNVKLKRAQQMSTNSCTELEHWFRK